MCIRDSDQGDVNRHNEGFAAGLVDGRRRRFEHLETSGAEHDVGASLSSRHGHGGAQSRRGAGNDHNPVIESEGVSTPGQRLLPALDSPDTQSLDGVE